MPPRQTIFQSFRVACRGFIEICLTQRNLRIQLVAGFVAATLAAALRFDPFRWAVLLLVIGLVLTAECINSAIEAVVDLASPGFHPLAARAKDFAAAAALVAAATSVVVGLCLFLPPLWKLLAVGLFQP